MNELPEPKTEVTITKIIPPTATKDTDVIELAKESAFSNDRGRKIRMEYIEDPEKVLAFHERKETGTVHPLKSESNLSALTIGTGTAWALMTLDHAGLKGISTAGESHFFTLESGRIGLWENSGFPRALNFEKLPGELKDFHHEAGSDTMAVVLRDGSVVVFTIQQLDAETALKACVYKPEDLGIAA